jgi:hypothetical protein
MTIALRITRRRPELPCSAGVPAGSCAAAPNESGNAASSVKASPTSRVRRFVMRHGSLAG